MELLHAVHVPEGDGPFPTVVALHGWGASAHDLFGLAPFFHGGQTLVICPQGPLRFAIGAGLPGYGWFPISGGGSSDPAAFAEAVAGLHRFLEQAVERYPVERRKLVLLGFSQGGALACELALREPARFAGLAALSSWLPAALAARIPRLPEHAALPVLVMHGSEDPLIPVARARESRDALLKLGVALTYREHPMGHEIGPQALRDLLEWLEGKVLSPIQLAGATRL